MITRLCITFNWWSIMNTNNSKSPNCCLLKVFNLSCKHFAGTANLHAIFSITGNIFIVCLTVTTNKLTSAFSKLNVRHAQLLFASSTLLRADFLWLFNLSVIVSLFYFFQMFVTVNLLCYLYARISK